MADSPSPPVLVCQGVTRRYPGVVACDHILTSALKKVDVAVFEAVQRAQEGNFKGGTDVIATVENGGVGLGKISAAGQKYADQVKKVQDQIAAGEITDIPDTVK